MMHASAYGRLGQDPRSHETKTGKTMATCTLAVDIAREEDTGPLWLGIVAFGGKATDLMRHGKGELISVSGRVQRNTYTTRDGQAREQLQIVVDVIVSARTVRPGKARKPKPKSEEHAATDEFNDEIPF